MQEEQSVQSELAPAASAPDAAPEAHPIKLTVLQEQALQQLAAGSTIAKAAEAAGVHRRTVSRWLHSDPHFAAAYNAWRKETMTSARARVLAMADLALDTMQSAMHQGNAHVAVQVAKAAGALNAQTPGPADPEHLDRRLELHAGRQELTLKAAEKELRLRRVLDDTWMKTPKEMEREIESLLKERREALKTETPEQRAERLSWHESRRRSNSTEFLRLLELSDATITAEGDGAPEDLQPLRRPTPDSSILHAACNTGTPIPVGADGSAVPEIAAGTPLDALPAAPPLTAARSPDRPADPPPPPPAPPPSVKSFAAPLPPPAPRPRSLSVRYDGSDDDDNDPDWKRIG